MRKFVFLLILLLNIVPVIRHGKITTMSVNKILAQGYGSESGSSGGNIANCYVHTILLDVNVAGCTTYSTFKNVTDCDNGQSDYSSGSTWVVSSIDQSCIDNQNNNINNNNNNSGAINKALCGSFHDIINKIFDSEKGFWNDPIGGYTNHGIKFSVWQANAQKYLGEAPTLENLQNLTTDQAELIYRGEYWNVVHAEQINDGDIRYAVVDFFINAYSGAIKTMQETLNQLGANVAVDGGMGSETINAINNANSVLLYNTYNQNRLAFYNYLCTNPRFAKAKRDKYQKNMNGWRNRVNSFKQKTSSNMYNVNCN